MAMMERNLLRVYSKSELGKDAIANRSIPLLALDRRVLILIDGERSVAELYQQLNAHDVLSALQRLLEKGLIHAAQAEEKPALVLEKTTQAASHQAASAAPTPQVTPPAPELINISLSGEVLAAVKALMLKTSRESLGLMATRLIHEIEQIDDASSLKTMMARWNMALRESRSAAARADQLLQEAKDLLPLAW